MLCYDNQVWKTMHVLVTWICARYFWVFLGNCNIPLPVSCSSHCSLWIRMRRTPPCIGERSAKKIMALIHWNPEKQLESYAQAPTWCLKWWIASSRQIASTVCQGKVEDSPKKIMQDGLDASAQYASSWCHIEQDGCWLKKWLLMVQLTWRESCSKKRNTKEKQRKAKNTRTTAHCKK